MSVMINLFFLGVCFVGLRAPWPADADAPGPGLCSAEEAELSEASRTKHGEEASAWHWSIAVPPAYVNRGRRGSASGAADALAVWGDAAARCRLLYSGAVFTTANSNRASELN